MDGSVTDGSVRLPDGFVPRRDASFVHDGGADAGIRFPDAGLPADGGSTPMAHVGTPCSSNADCPGLVCSPAGGGGFGYCTWLCSDTMGCPSGSVCATYGGSTVGYCMPTCDPTSPSCNVGYLCEPGVAAAPVCYPGCNTDADCADGTRCGSGVSGVRACYTPGSQVGDPCTVSSECPDGGYCIDEASWGAPHGLCVTFCDLSTGTGCDTGTTCVPWGYGGSYGSCVPTCDDANPCRQGYACVSTGSGGPNACVARCTSDADCEAGDGCNFVTGLCRSGG